MGKDALPQAPGLRAILLDTFCEEMLASAVEWGFTAEEFAIAAAKFSAKLTVQRSGATATAAIFRQIAETLQTDFITCQERVGHAKN